MKKNKTTGEKSYHAYLSQFSCIACGSIPVTIHHIRDFAGMGQRSSHFHVLPLCVECHQGQDGIHHNRKIFEMRWGTEISLLADVWGIVWNDKGE